MRHCGLGTSNWRNARWSLHRRREGCLTSMKRRRHGPLCPLRMSLFTCSALNFIESAPTLTARGRCLACYGVDLCVYAKEMVCCVHAESASARHSCVSLGWCCCGQLKHKAISSKYHVPESERADFVEPSRVRNQPSKETGDMFVAIPHLLATQTHAHTRTRAQECTRTKCLCVSVPCECACVLCAKK